MAKGHSATEGRGRLQARLASIAVAALCSPAHAQVPAVDLSRPLTALFLLAIVGLVLWFAAPHWLRWVGRLPGDIRIKRGGTRVYFPIATAVVLSLALSLLTALLGYLPALAPYLWGWFGSLPGDIRIRRDGFTLFLPITSMLLASLLLSALLSSFAWLRRRSNKEAE
jgi:hypothetical protein